MWGSSNVFENAIFFFDLLGKLCSWFNLNVWVCFSLSYSLMVLSSITCLALKSPYISFLVKSYGLTLYL